MLHINLHAILSNHACYIYTGSVALRMKDGTISGSLPIFLDDLGCNGTESNLLECLPHHNCYSPEENAVIFCLHRGNLISQVKVLMHGLAPVMFR